MRYLGGTTRALAPITAVCLALTLAACTSTPAANPTRPAVSSSPSPPAPPPAPTPTPEPSPTSTAELPDVTVAPAPPAALDGPPTEENAAAVAEYYMSLFPYLFATGDSTTWEQLSGTACGYCSGVVDELRKDEARGRQSEGGALEFLDGGADATGSEEFIAWVTFVQHPSQTIDAQGTVVEDFHETRRTRATLLLEWDGGTWQVNGVDPVLIEVM